MFFWLIIPLFLPSVKAQEMFSLSLGHFKFGQGPVEKIVKRFHLSENRLRKAEKIIRFPYLIVRNGVFEIPAFMLQIFRLRMFGSVPAGTFFRAAPFTAKEAQNSSSPIIRDHSSECAAIYPRTISVAPLNTSQKEPAAKKERPKGRSSDNIPRGRAVCRPTKDERGRREDTGIYRR